MKSLFGLVLVLASSAASAYNEVVKVRCTWTDMQVVEKAVEKFPIQYGLIHHEAVKALIAQDAACFRISPFEYQLISGYRNYTLHISVGATESKSRLSIVRTLQQQHQ